MTNPETSLIYGLSLLFRVDKCCSSYELIRRATTSLNWGAKGSVRYLNSASTWDDHLLVDKDRLVRAAVVALLVERSLMTPEIHSSNPDIGKLLSYNCTIEKTGIKKRRQGMAHL